MGILTQAEKTYYLTGGSHGNYRFVELREIIDSFTATYVGEGKICNNVTLNDITFHAIRAMQELSYDTLRSAKDWEVVIPSTLVLVMPVDYVNYVKLSWSDSVGTERIYILLLRRLTRLMLVIRSRISVDSILVD